MKKTFRFLGIALVATSMLFFGCNKTEETEEEPEQGNTSTPIRQGTIGSGTFTDYSNTQIPNSFGLDFDNNGTIEFKISDGSRINEYITYAWTDGGNNVFASDEGWDYAAALTQGTDIGPNSRWDGQGDCMVSATTPNQFYIGFRFKLSDGVHYGWAKVTVNSSSVTWDKIFYHTTPNMSIKAGDEG